MWRGRKKGEENVGLDQRPGNQSGGGFSPWLLRGKTEDRGDARETQPRTGKGDEGWEGRERRKRSEKLAATGVRMKTEARQRGLGSQPSSGPPQVLTRRPLAEAGVSRKLGKQPPP